MPTLFIVDSLKLCTRCLTAVCADAKNDGSSAELPHATSGMTILSACNSHII